MGKIYNSILELIGNTPMLHLNKIEAAEAEGKLKPGGKIVEGTSGNTGIGIALV